MESFSVLYGHIWFIDFSLKRDQIQLENLYEIQFNSANIVRMEVTVLPHAKHLEFVLISCGMVSAQVKLVNTEVLFFRKFKNAFFKLFTCTSWNFYNSILCLEFLYPGLLFLAWIVTQIFQRWSHGLLKVLCVIALWF